MTLYICISDYWQHKIFYKITPNKEIVNKNNNISKNYGLDILQTLKESQVEGPNVVQLPAKEIHVMKRLKWNIDGINFYYLNKELLEFLEYRKVLSTQLNEKWAIKLLWLQIVQPERDIIDWKW